MFSRALSVLAWVIAAVMPGSLLGHAPEAKPSPSEASASSIAITNVTVIDVITGAHQSGSQCLSVMIGLPPSYATAGL
jgi:hypothetical protein